MGPSDLATLWQDTAGTSAVTADGQSVARIDDKSGNARHLTQATAAARPLYKTSGGLHWLEFDGVDDTLRSAANMTSFRSVSAYEASTAVRIVAYVAGKAVIEDEGSYFSHGEPSSTTNIRNYQYQGGNRFANTAYTVGSDIVVSGRHESGTLYVQNNADAEGTGASGNVDAGWGLLRLGRHSGRVYGALISGTVLSVANRNALRAWMGAKAGLTL